MKPAEAFAHIMAAQQQSGMTPADFYIALVRVAGNSTILRAALNHSTYTTGAPRPEAAEKPIEIEPIR